ncbi:MAG: IPExxxVDY family protein [Cyclobacteriaceae bacterium]|nr:IPExxxVDY family protein [Cyclobacteriaceae bacterium]
MKKNKLIVEYDFDFELAGVISALKGYKLAWEINRKLGVKLVRQPDLPVGFKKGEERYFSFYAYETPLNRLKLFKNKPIDYETGKYFLVPEFPRFDFILLTASEDNNFTSMILQTIKEIPSVELVTPIAAGSLKSRSNFIF